MKHQTTRSASLPGYFLQRVRAFAAMAIAAVLISWNPTITTRASVGLIDSSFGIGGTITTNVGETDITLALAVQVDNRIVVAGGIENLETSTDFALARYRPDGVIDKSFGSSGVVITRLSDGFDQANALAIQPDKYIVAAGYAMNGLGNYDFALARYDSSGNLDAGFGREGTVTTDFGSAEDMSVAMGIQPDGKIVAAGWTTGVSGGYDFALARYNADGSLDTAFGNGGKVVGDFAGGDDMAYAIAFAGNRIILAGSTTGTNAGNDFALACYDAQGNLDSTFGIGGKVTTDFSGLGDIARSLAVLPDGKMIVAGYATNEASGKDFALVRYDTNGNLDSTFANNGMVSTSFGKGDDLTFAMKVMPNGKIISVGCAHATGPQGHKSNDFAIACYSPNGSLDATFGSNGLVTTDFFGDEDRAMALGLMPNGSIVVAGCARGNWGDDFALACYTGVEYDFVLQDDLSGKVLTFNSATGDYKFLDCGKGTLMYGVGVVTINPYACKISLSDQRADRSVSALVNRCTYAGSATIKMLTTATKHSINDSDYGNSTGECRNRATKK